MFDRWFFFLVFLRAHQRVLAFAALGALLVMVYWPSLQHIARGDQISYFAEVSARHGFRDVVLGTFDLNRTRTFTPGDTQLFEPLLYLILGLETFFFGYNFIWWQAVGIAAHIFAAGALYALLCRIRGGWFALAATAFFALLLVNVEAVVWQHITSFVVFAGCTLMALRHIYALEAGGEEARRHWPAALAWTTAGAFIYVTGVWYALALGVFLWRRGERRAACLFWAAGGGYVVWSATNMAQLGLDPGGAHLLSHGEFWLTFANMAALTKWCVSMAVFLGTADLWPVSRMMGATETTGWLWPWGHLHTLPAVAGCVLLVTAVFWFFCRGFSRAAARKHRDLLVLCGLMICGYLFVITLGRLNDQGKEQLFRTCLYYPYNFLPLLLVMLALITGPRPAVQSLRDRVARYALPAALAVFLVVSAAGVWRMNTQMARDHAPTRIFLAALDKFVRAHEKEPGFSFYVMPGYPGNLVASSLFRLNDPPGRQYTFAEALYRRHFTVDRPKYVIRLPEM